MSRNYLLIAAGALLVAAAVVHFTGGLSTSPSTSVADVDPGEATERAPFGTGHELVDPLVPPIQLGNAASIYLDDDMAEEDLIEEVEFPVVALAAEPVLGPKGWTKVRLHGAIHDGEFRHGERAYFDGHTGNVCASGCAWNSAPTKRLTGEHYLELLEVFAVEPMDETSFALESLLYFGRQTRLMISKYGTAPIDPLRDAFLRSELQKTHAYIEIEMVDEFGVIRTSLPPTLVPLDRRHIFDMSVHDVQPLETSGTIKRVGLYHLWTRL